MKVLFISFSNSQDFFVRSNVLKHLYWRTYRHLAFFLEVLLASLQIIIVQQMQCPFSLPVPHSGLKMNGFCTSARISFKT
jgi:hypothetical protein